MRVRLVPGTLLLALSASLLTAQDEPDTAARTAHRERMNRVAESIRISAVMGGKSSAVSVAAEPVLRYTDPTRKQHDSALWIWGTGRPTAIMAVEFYPQSPRGPRWLYEIASLSTGIIAASREGTLDWKAQGPGLTLKPLPDAPAPADKPALRLVQMRQFQRRFKTRETAVVDGPIVLRPVANPIHRYADPAAGVIDGAILSFANGTNPEVLLILEVHGAAGEQGAWKYGLVQMTGAEVSAELDGERVWSCREADPPATRDAYVNGWIPEQAAAP